MVNNLNRKQTSLIEWKPFYRTNKIVNIYFKCKLDVKYARENAKISECLAHSKGLFAICAEVIVTTSPDNK